MKWISFHFFSFPDRMGLDGPDWTRNEPDLRQIRRRIQSDLSDSCTQFLHVFQIQIFSKEYSVEFPKQCFLNLNHPKFRPGSNQMHAWMNSFTWSVKHNVNSELRGPPGSSGTENPALEVFKSCKKSKERSRIRWMILNSFLSLLLTRVERATDSYPGYL